MTVEGMIDKYGEDVEIHRDDDFIVTTKALFQKGNRVHLKSNEDVRNRDQIHRIKTTDVFTVMKVDPVADQYIEVTYEET